MTSASQEFRAAIQDALGNAPDEICPGELHRFATSHKPSDKAGWCKLFDDERGGVFGCHRQGLSVVWRHKGHDSGARKGCALSVTSLRDARLARTFTQQSAWGEAARQNAPTWSESVSVTEGDPVALYLRSRGISDLSAVKDVLRFHQSLPYWDGIRLLGHFPAMVAPLTAADDTVVALHKTYLSPGGCKAAVPIVKKLTRAAGPLTGSSIRLHACCDGEIGIAEGIETALAAHCASAIPAVAAYCASNLASWSWPTDARRVVVFADNDKVGKEAAEKLRARALFAQLRCDVVAPTKLGADWCDVWARRECFQIEGGKL